MTIKLMILAVLLGAHGLFSRQDNGHVCNHKWGTCAQRSGNLGGTGYRSNPHMCDVIVYSETKDHPSKRNPHSCVACGEPKTS